MKDASPFLVFTLGSRTCAVPVAHVAETMRSLHLEAFPDAPAFVLGVSLIRGEPVPVVDPGVLLDGVPLPESRRLVLLRVTPDRHVAMLTSTVVGIRQMDREIAPPLLAGVASGAVESLATLDGNLVNVLRASILVPDDVRQHLDDPRRETP